MQIKHLIAVAGGHTAAALAPILNGVFPIGRATILCGKGQSTSHFRSTLEQQGVQTNIIKLETLDDPGVVHRAIELALKQSDSEEIAALNLSGANPVVSAVGTHLFRMKNQPVFYLHPRSHEIIWLSLPENSEMPSQIHSPSGLGLEQHLNLAGLSMVAYWQRLKQRRAEYDAFANHLAVKASKNPAYVCEFGNLCRQADSDSRLSAPISSQPELMALAAKLVEHNLAAEYKTGDKLHLRLRDTETINFLGGGWLEHLLLKALAGLQAKGIVQDAACSVKIDLGGGVCNELDGLAIANGRLYVFECKARKGKLGSPRMGIGPETIYKIDSIRAIRDFSAEAVLVTLAKPSAVEQSRLDSEGIHHISGSGIGNLEQELANVFKTDQD